MSASRLSIDESEPGHLRASGVVDAHTADSLATALEGAGVSDDVVLDLADVDFIDSSGLRVIVAAHTRIGDAGHRLVLSSVSEAVERLFEITGLHDHLHVAD